MHRLSAIAGLGLFVRPVYRAGLDFISGMGKPDGRDSDAASKVDSHLDVAMLSARHGPWIEAGLVW